MVMRNRHDGANAPEWWDDLPPGVKKRCAGSSQNQETDESESPAQSSRWFPVRIVSDLSWLALLFIAIAFANLLLLLIAVSFLYGRGLFGR